MYVRTRKVFENKRVKFHAESGVQYRSSVVETSVSLAIKEEKKNLI